MAKKARKKKGDAGRMAAQRTHWNEDAPWPVPVTSSNSESSSSDESEAPQKRDDAAAAMMGAVAPGTGFNGQSGLPLPPM